MSVFEDREGNIWVGIGDDRTEPVSEKATAVQALPQRGRAIQQSLLRTSVTSVYADSQENIWVGSSIGLTRIDGKTGEYSILPESGARSGEPLQHIRALDCRGSLRLPLVRHVWGLEPVRSADEEICRLPA